MPPEKIAQLIFEPGFSTAEKVTEVSGRGVGMDAVKGFVEDEGGTITLEFLSEHNQGDFRPFETVIRLPKKFAVLVVPESLELLAMAPVVEQHSQTALQALNTLRSFFQEEQISDV